MAAVQTIQMLGLIGAASYGLARLAQASRRAAWHRYAIIAQPRAGLPQMPRGFAVRELSATDLADHAVDAEATVLAQRFADGLACLGAFDRHDQLTGLIWLREQHYDEDEVAARIMLPSGCCWDTGLWIAPEHRMGRSFAALWAGVAGWMDARNLACSLSRVSDYNRIALLSHGRMNARVLAHCTFVRAGAWQWSTAARPRLLRLAHSQNKARAVLDLRGLVPAELAGGQAAMVSAS